MKVTWKSITAVVLGVATIISIILSKKLLPGFYNEIGRGLIYRKMLVFVLPLVIVFLFSALPMLRKDRLFKSKTIQDWDLLPLIPLLACGSCVFAVVPCLISNLYGIDLWFQLADLVYVLLFLSSYWLYAASLFVKFLNICKDGWKKIYWIPVLLFAAIWFVVTFAFRYQDNDFFNTARNSLNFLALSGFCTIIILHKKSDKTVLPYWFLMFVPISLIVGKFINIDPIGYKGLISLPFVVLTIVFATIAFDLKATSLESDEPSIAKTGASDINNP